MEVVFVILKVLGIILIVIFVLSVGTLIFLAMHQPIYLQSIEQEERDYGYEFDQLEQIIQKIPAEYDLTDYRTNPEDEYEERL